MDKKELFKEFARKHPELIDYVNNNKDITWQKLYEIYDIYGDDINTWKPYLKTKNTSITDMVKNIDVKTIQEHVNNAQKALSVIQELTTKGGETINSLKGPLSPRPITKFFGD